MAYLPNIPQPGDRLKDSQPQILANFQAIKVAFEINHGDFGTADEGKHVLVSLPENAGLPVIAAGDLGIYARLYTVTNKSEVWVHKNNSTTTVEIPFTASILGFLAINPGIHGWTFLPSGILLTWIFVTDTGLATITIPPTFPTYNAIFSVSATLDSPSTVDTNKAVRFVDILSPTQFRIFFSNRTTVGPATASATILIIGA